MLFIAINLLSNFNAQTSNVGDIWITSPDHNPVHGESFLSTISVNLGSQPLGAYEISLNYVPSVVNILGISPEAGSPFSSYTYSNSMGYHSGLTKIVAFQNSDMFAPIGVVEMCYVNFIAVGQAGESSVLGITVNIMSDTSGSNITANPINGSVTINASTEVINWKLY